MLLSVLRLQRFGHCATCNVETDVWVCTYDHVPDRGGINHQFFCDGDLWGELEYIARLGVPINDERAEPPVELHAMLEQAYAVAAARAAEPPPSAVVKHTCHRPGCEVEVPPKLLACRPHWYELKRGAPDVANAILTAYRPGQEITKTPSADYMEAARQAREFWEERDRLKAALTSEEV